jgi:hypothetical protein
VVKSFVQKKFKLDLSPQELAVLTTLVENQFFRMKYIDPRMPGYSIHPDKFRASQSAVALLSDAMKKERGLPVRPEIVQGAKPSAQPKN